MRRGCWARIRWPRLMAKKRPRLLPGGAGPRSSQTRTIIHKTGQRHRRVTVRPRSCLDPGPEVLRPAQATDYAFPPGYSPTSSFLIRSAMCTDS